MVIPIKTTTTTTTTTTTATATTAAAPISSLGNNNTFLVIGIPTVTRLNVSYLISTINSLVHGLDDIEKAQVHIVVFMADLNNNTNTTELEKQIESTFPHDYNKLIHCIRAPWSFYPAKNDVAMLWGHTKARSQWLSKQSLDYSFLWKYCATLSSQYYYLHLEDDCLAQQGYLKTIKTFIQKHQYNKWSSLVFGDKGSLGVLYRSSDLPPLHKFTRIFSWFYPVDILVRQFNEFHLYGNAEWTRHDPPVFHHVGEISSFQGQTFVNETLRLSVNQSEFHQVGNLSSFQGRPTFVNETLRLQVNQSFNFSFPGAEIVAPLRRKPRGNAFLIIGVPTVKRKKESYLVDTLKGLIRALQESEKHQVLILIFLADIKRENIKYVSNEVHSNFPKELRNGLIKIIKAPSSYYPSLEGLPVLWKDKPDRIKWRSKQCLDYAFLFNYIYSKYPDKYYLHIEDDIISSPGYLEKIKNFINVNSKKTWSLLEFANTLGFIGFLYRSSDLGRLAQFIRTYYWSLPVDMLSRHYHEFHLYGNPKWAVHKPQLFYHGGSYSSLDGVTRPAKVIPVRQYKDCFNPPATITTSIKPAMKQYHDISRTYAKKDRFDYFWGRDISIGDYILLHFSQPEKISKFAVISGGKLAKLDFLGGAKVLRSDSQDCKRFLLWQEFKEEKHLTIVEPKGMLCTCIKIEVTALRKDDKKRARWLLIEDIAIWT